MELCPVCGEMTVDPTQMAVSAYNPSGLGEAVAQSAETRSVRCGNDSCKALLVWNPGLGKWDSAGGDEPGGQVSPSSH
jgi:hypothetical protein